MRWGKSPLSAPHKNVGHHSGAATKDAQWHQGHSGSRFNESEGADDEYRGAKANESDNGGPTVQARRYDAVHKQKGSDHHSKRSGHVQSFPKAGAWVDGSSGRESASAAAPIGTLTRKIQCQPTLYASTAAPPTQPDLDQAHAQVANDVDAVSPVVAGSARVIAGSQNWSTRISAVSPAYRELEDWQVASGAFFTDEDNANSSNVAVLGQTVVTNLFPNGDSPIGQLIRIRNVPFTVTGTLVSKGSGIGGDHDDTVLIPFQTGQVRLFGATSVNQIIVQVNDPAQMTDVQQEVQQLLHVRHRIQSGQADDFNVRNNADITSRVSGVTTTLTLLLGGVAAVSLVVGGIGILNIMLVSVTERTREIGIRLAIGARPNDILTQFMVEAVVLSVLGGLIGILIGSGVALLMPLVAGWATLLPWRAVALAFGVSASIGIFFGMYPARKASQLDPIDALRYE